MIRQSMRTYCAVIKKLLGGVEKMRCCREQGRTAIAFASGVLVSCFFSNKFVMIVLAVAVICISRGIVRC